MSPETARRHHDQDARDAEAIRFAIELAQMGLFVDPFAFHANYRAESSARSNRKPRRG